MSHKFNYIWMLADGFPAKGIEPNNRKVFGTFVCGGGSAMGYKLAGYDYLGGVEIDPKVAEIYKRNLNPKYLFVNDIRDFNKMDLPDELYNLDILDGSPPCTTFSIAGSREETWGRKKIFAEGQSKQRLDDLVFVYCDTIKKLMPKVCLLENVGGLLRGNARAYAKVIKKNIETSGYNVQVFLLDAQTMGVPQMRERCFFVGARKDLNVPKLKLDFKEPPINFKQIKDRNGEPITGEKTMLAWQNRRPSDRNIGDTNVRVLGKKSNFNTYYAKDDQVLNCLTSSAQLVHYSEPVKMSTTEMMKAATFPMDYNAPSTKIQFLTGMCVPPVMTAQIAHQINEQWFRRID